MDTSYTIPKDARIGHVHLKVSDMQRSLDFYYGLLGFELTTTYGLDAAFISAGGYHHHIGLNVWFSKNAPPAPRNTAGLFHIAICYPTRNDLAVIFKRLQEAGNPLSGASDHGLSEALEDPDQNGLELYWDKPRGYHSLISWEQNQTQPLKGSIHPKLNVAFIGTIAYYFRIS
jgi:catechol 2,3-dioxygenase